MQPDAHQAGAVNRISCSHKLDVCLSCPSFMSETFQTILNPPATANLKAPPPSTPDVACKLESSTSS